MWGWLPRWVQSRWRWEIEFKTAQTGWASEECKNRPQFYIFCTTATKDLCIFKLESTTRLQKLQPSETLTLFDFENNKKAKFKKLKMLK